MPDSAAALNLDFVRRYLAALESDDPSVDIGVFFAADVVQEEFPNRLVPQGARRDLAALREGREKGRRALRQHRFEVQNAFASGNQVAVEAIWSAELLVALGALKPGDRMRARFAIFVELRDGKIVSQRNYDCFDPF